jgi:hypothetical protein
MALECDLLLDNWNYSAEDDDVMSFIHEIAQRLIGESEDFDETEKPVSYDKSAHNMGQLWDTLKLGTWTHLNLCKLFNFTVSFPRGLLDAQRETWKCDKKRKGKKLVGHEKWTKQKRRSGERPERH